MLSAAVLAPLALGCIWLGGAAFAGLVALISVGLSYEWLGLCGQRQSVPFWALFAALPLCVLLAARGSVWMALALLVIACGAVACIAGGLTKRRPAAFGVPYIGLGALALVWLRQPVESGTGNVSVLLLVIWASDIGAYIAGRSIGGKRLAPSVSPGKTWSGALGGLLAAAAVGSIAGPVVGHGDFGIRPTMVAVLLGCVSQAGDLFESLLKRHFGVKDSGALIPGHGGLLDRLDAVLVAAPVAALLALWLGRGVSLWE